MRKKVLFIGGSVNQTSMMHALSRYFQEYDCFFTPYYIGNFRDGLMKKYFDFSILGGKYKQHTLEYLASNNLKIDAMGSSGDYDFVVTCQDLIIQKNIKNKRIFLVQEGMTDPQRLGYFCVKRLGFPRWIAGTSATGLSNAYDLFFVASKGYADLFIKNGVRPEKIMVTGIPNFDDVKRFLKNDFPYKNFVLALTSNLRECMEYENRREFILKAVSIAAGRTLIFKLHPSENMHRAVREIKRHAPHAFVYYTGNTNHLIANCDVLITRYSSTVFIGEALGKEIHADIPLAEVRQLAPIQNGGDSARRIAVCIKNHLEKLFPEYRRYHSSQRGETFNHAPRRVISARGRAFAKAPCGLAIREEP